jgi:hypothetical protein
MMTTSTNNTDLAFELRDNLRLVYLATKSLGTGQGIAVPADTAALEHGLRQLMERADAHCAKAGASGSTLRAVG